MKTNTTLKIFLILIFITNSVIIFSQKAPEKFGKISTNEFKNNMCPIDSNAHAYYIFDYGKSYFEYAGTHVESNDPESSKKGFQLHYTRHFRIKIVDNQGFSWANITIPLYHDGNAENIGRLRAYTYNLENGKIKKTKLSRKDIFNEETNKYWITRKFAMPNVQEGSIIEIEYSITSDYYFNLREWYFQKAIPVLQSEYHVKIPEYFIYNQTQKGYFPVKTETDTQHEEITITFHQKQEGSTVQERTYTSTFDYRENVFDYYAEKIPAFPVEEYLRTEENYISKMEFELNYTKLPNSPIKTYTTSWEAINHQLLIGSSFGTELKKNYHIKNEAKALKQLYQNDSMLLDVAFNFIKNKLSWNGQKSKYVTSTLSKAYKNGGGNAADINLNLIILLRELGIDAFPVILSTQEHGIIHPSFPSISSFNYVITMAIIGEDTLLMDATDPYSEINLLPIRCLNDKGRIVNNEEGNWVTLMDYKPYSIVESYNLELNDNDGFDGVKEMSLKDYAAYDYKKEIKKYNTNTEYIESIEKNYKDYDISKIDVIGLDSIKGKMKISLEFVQNNYIEKSNDIAFFKPVYHPFVSQNPFKLENRDYPVEFDYPYTVQQIYSISIPANYTITEIPQSTTISTPDGRLKYIYSIMQLGNKITIVTKFSISKTLFLPDEYQALKIFHQVIIDKQNEMIVLKIAE